MTWDSWIYGRVQEFINIMVEVGLHYKWEVHASVLAGLKLVITENRVLVNRHLFAS